MTVTWIQCVFVVITAASISFVVTGWVRGVALQCGVIDIPNARSSHVVPTPRGGGAGIVAGFLAVLAALVYFDLFPRFEGAVILAGTLAIAALGWVDDVRCVPVTVRLGAQFLIASFVVAGLGGFSQLRVGMWVVELGWIGSIVTVIGLVWLTNLYNFMDGIDGLAAAEAVTVSLALAVLGAWSGVSHIGFSLAALGLAAAGAAFMVWNWSPAKVFMGDVGSAALGFAFGALAIVGETQNGPPLLAMVLLLGLFVADSTLTLFDRWRRGQNITVAHRDHVYQRLVRVGFSHRHITLGAIAVNVAFLWPAAWLATQRDVTMPWVFVTAFTLLGLLWWWVMRWFRRLAKSG